MLNSDSNISTNYYSIEEVKEKLSALDNVTWTKLLKIGKSITYFYKIAPEDLLQDVFDKLFNEERNWPKNLDIYIFFRNTMKSILSNELKKDKKEIFLNSRNENGDEIINTISDEKITIENDLILRQIREDIRDLFKDDEIAHDLVDGRMENLKRSELMELTDLTEKEYDTKWKMIRRRIDKKYPRGWQNGK